MRFVSLLCMAGLLLGGCGRNETPPEPTIELAKPLPKAAGIRPTPEQIDRAVLEAVAEVLNVKPADLQVGEPFARQSKPGTALDIIEAIMIITRRTGVAVSSEAIDEACGSTGSETTAEKLTIAILQKVVRDASGISSRTGPRPAQPANDLPEVEIARPQSAGSPSEAK